MKPDSLLSNCEGCESVQKLTARLELMRTLLYTIKAGVPAGRIAAVLVVLCALSGLEQTGNEIILTEAEYQALARSANLSTGKLKDSLDYLQQQGIICYSRSKS